MDGNLSRRTKGWDHGQRDKWADKWVVERAHGQTDEGTSKPPNNDTLQRLGGRTNGSAEWRRDGQRDGRTDGKTPVQYLFPPLNQWGGIITDGCFCMLPNQRSRASRLQFKLYKELQFAFGGPIIHAAPLVSSHQQRVLAGYWRPVLRGIGGVLVGIGGYWRSLGIKPAHST